MPADLLCLLRRGDHLQGYVVKIEMPAVRHTGGLLANLVAVCHQHYKAELTSLKTPWHHQDSGAGSSNGVEVMRQHFHQIHTAMDSVRRMSA